MQNAVSSARSVFVVVVMALLGKVAGLCHPGHVLILSVDEDVGEDRDWQ